MHRVRLSSMRDLVVRIILPVIAVLSVAGAMASEQQPLATASPSVLVARLRMALDMYDEREANIATDELQAAGEAAILSIEAALSSGDTRLAPYLLRCLGGLGGDEATSLLMAAVGKHPHTQLAANAVFRLENRHIRRALTEAELGELVRMVGESEIIAAGNAARVLARCDCVDPALKAEAITARFCREVETPTHPESVWPAYLSPRVYVLNQFLLAFSDLGTPPIPVLASCRESSTAAETKTWLCLALGMAGDARVADELEQLIRMDEDKYLRWAGIPAYAKAAGKAAIPLLESLLNDETVTDYEPDNRVPGQKTHLIRGAARRALYGTGGLEADRATQND